MTRFQALKAAEDEFDAAYNATQKGLGFHDGLG